MDEQLDQMDKQLVDALDTLETKKAKGKKKPGSSRGIETMFRSTYQVQMDLTGLADNKANMMISINGIIISVIIAAVAPKLDSNPWLLIPTTIFLLGTLISMVFAILAARPRVVRDGPDGSRAKGNILFFGDFTRMREDEFVAGMNELMADRTEMYGAMIRNIYGLGGVLRMKFGLLQVAYTSFMMALILGVLSFIGVFLWIEQNATL